MENKIEKFIMQMFTFSLGIVLGTFLNNHSGYVSKKKIIESAPKTWRANSFTCNDVTMKDSFGNETFYPAKTIDEWIERMNVILSKK